jgi:hypothetical protein
MKYLLSLLLLFASLTAAAQMPKSLWRGEDGNPLPETEARKSVNGLGVWLILTPGEEWKEEVQSPASTTPDVLESSEVARGQTLTTLIFIANPKPDKTGLANVLCDIKVTRADGTTSTNSTNTACLTGPLVGPALFVRLAIPRIAFVSEATDPAGLWQVEIVVKDLNRGIEVPVRAEFTVLE